MYIEICVELDDTHPEGQRTTCRRRVCRWSLSIRYNKRSRCAYDLWVAHKQWNWSFLWALQYASSMPIQQNTRFYDSRDCTCSASASSACSWRRVPAEEQVQSVTRWVDPQHAWGCNQSFCVRWRATGLHWTWRIRFLVKFCIKDSCKYCIYMILFIYIYAFFVYTYIHTYIFISIYSLQI